MVGRVLISLALWLFGAASASMPPPSTSTREDVFLPPEQAYRYVTSLQHGAGGDKILVSWVITPGYYLYRERLGFESPTPGITLGAAVFPRGESHQDEYF